jgi:hypothetical protein
MSLPASTTALGVAGGYSVEYEKLSIQADSSTVECLLYTEEVARFNSCSAYHPNDITYRIRLAGHT